MWLAITDPRQLGEWFLPTEVDPTDPGRFRLYPVRADGLTGALVGEVVEEAPPSHLAVRWHGDAMHVYVSMRIEETADGCRLTFVQRGFFGPSGTLRRRTLHSTYTRMLTQRLPALLARDPEIGEPEPGTTLGLGAAAPARPAPTARLVGVGLATSGVGAHWQSLLPGRARVRGRAAVPQRSRAGSVRPGPPAIAGPPAARPVSAARAAVPRPTIAPGATIALRAAVAARPRRASGRRAGRLVTGAHARPAGAHPILVTARGAGAWLTALPDRTAERPGTAVALAALLMVLLAAVLTVIHTW